MTRIGIIGNGNVGSALAGGLERAGHDVRAVGNELDVPLYDGDAEAAHGIPNGAEDLVRRLLESDAFILGSPEYNGSMPGTI